MGSKAAGLLMFRRTRGALEVLLGHPGGPFFARKDAGAWSVFKGLYEDGEDALAAARRELAEETGLSSPEDGYLDLGEVRQKGGKTVRVFAFEGDCDPATLRSNTFEIEWPPRSGRRAAFPEVDRSDWFDLERARAAMNPAQVELLDRLAARLAEPHEKPR